MTNFSIAETISLVCQLNNKESGKHTQTISISNNSSVVFDDLTMYLNKPFTVDSKDEIKFTYNLSNLFISNDSIIFTYEITNSAGKFLDWKITQGREGHGTVISRIDGTYKSDRYVQGGLLGPVDGSGSLQTTNGLCKKREPNKF